MKAIWSIVGAVLVCALLGSAMVGCGGGGGSSVAQIEKELDALEAKMADINRQESDIEKRRELQKKYDADFSALEEKIAKVPEAQRADLKGRLIGARARITMAK
jgi:hypothetical protein